MCLWSGPRSISTALLYAFAGRGDTEVVDEPLYAHYLRVSGAAHPAREAVLRSQDPDGDRVIQDRVLGPCRQPVLVMKHMAHHLVDLDWSFLNHTVNVFLVREPESVLVSLSQVLPRPSAAATGLPAVRRIFEFTLGLGQAPLVVDARTLLEAPDAVLGTLCARLNLAYTPAMLTWARGGRREDGVWAPHWYRALHRSSGFATPGPVPSVPAALAPALATCRPHYEALRVYAINPASARRTGPVGRHKPPRSSGTESGRDGDSHV